MTTVHDVAAYVLRKQGAMSAMKLQKLAYYSQAWHLVWEDEPLFDNRIEAWANGPVAPELYVSHRGHFQVTSDLFPNVPALTAKQQSTIDSVLRFYGSRTAWDLSNLTHHEDPWRNARNGLQDGVRSNAEILPSSMAEYYGSLTA